MRQVQRLTGQFKNPGCVNQRVLRCCCHCTAKLLTLWLRSCFCLPLLVWKQAALLHLKQSFVPAIACWAALQRLAASGCAAAAEPVPALSHPSAPQRAPVCGVPRAQPSDAVRGRQPDSLWLVLPVHRQGPRFLEPWRHVGGGGGAACGHQGGVQVRNPRGAGLDAAGERARPAGTSAAPAQAVLRLRRPEQMATQDRHAAVWAGVCGL